MRSLVIAIGFVVGGFLVVPIVAAAGNSGAQIVSCTGFAGCFSPNPIRIATGSTVTWTNNTSLTHTATAENGAWDTGDIASGQTSAAVSFNTAGTFAYHCTIHPNMQGTIVVSAAVSATAPGGARPSAPPASRALAQAGAGPSFLLGAILLLSGLALFGLRYLNSQKKV